MKEIKYKIENMTCNSCENKIKNCLSKLDGIKEIDANAKRKEVIIKYIPYLIDETQIKNSLKDWGYPVIENIYTKYIVLLIVISGLLLLTFFTPSFNYDTYLNTNSFIVLFIIGLFTSLHCVGMCGGIMLSQSIGESSVKQSILYNVGRVIAYTLLGGIIGSLGAVLSLSNEMKAFVQIIAASLMILMGLNILGFRGLKVFSFHFSNHNQITKKPFIVGLLNGLIPCGPLQTMQLYALSTGSFILGATSMFIFALGTVPLMLGIGLSSNYFYKVLGKKIYKINGVLILCLGLVMINRGISQIGYNLNPFDGLIYNNQKQHVAKIIDGYQYIEMDVLHNKYSPSTIYVEKNIPIKWTINGKEVNGCNNVIIIPDLSIEIEIHDGKNEVESFRLSKDTNFSCWMCMKFGRFVVVDDLDKVN